MASTPSAAAESQEEILHSEPGGDLEGTAPYGPEEVFGFGKTHSVSMTGLSRVGHIGVCPSLMGV